MICMEWTTFMAVVAEWNSCCYQSGREYILFFMHNEKVIGFGSLVHRRISSFIFLLTFPMQIFSIYSWMLEGLHHYYGCWIGKVYMECSNIWPYLHDFCLLHCMERKIKWTRYWVYVNFHIHCFATQDWVVKSLGNFD